jgi:hypothetical protein
MSDNIPPSDHAKRGGPFSANVTWDEKFIHAVEDPTTENDPTLATCAYLIPLIGGLHIARGLPLEHPGRIFLAWIVIAFVLNCGIQ